jgi:hypothetical protein
MVAIMEQGVWGINRLEEDMKSDKKYLLWKSHSYVEIHRACSISKTLNSIYIQKFQ